MFMALRQTVREIQARHDSRGPETWGHGMLHGGGVIRYGVIRGGAEAGRGDPTAMRNSVKKM